MGFLEAPQRREVVDDLQQQGLSETRSCDLANIGRSSYRYPVRSSSRRYPSSAPSSGVLAVVD